MDLLYFYFPMSVDKLTPEFSLIYGEPPVLLESSNDKNAILTIFGNSGGMQSSLNGFGSEQVILVRDTETKEQIFSLVGKQALVLTILECKGLEFQVTIRKICVSLVTGRFLCNAIMQMIITSVFHVCVVSYRMFCFIISLEHLH